MVWQVNHLNPKIATQAYQREKGFSYSAQKPKLTAMTLSLEQIDAQIEELEAILPRLEKASTEKHSHEDAGWWLTMAGSPGGTALAVTSGNQAHELDTMISKVERKLVLLQATKISLQNQSATAK